MTSIPFEKARCPTCLRFLNKRSLEYNAYYWAAILPMISDYTGDTTEDQHEIFKFMFLPRRFITVEGKEIEVAKSSADLSSKDFHDFVERVIEFASKEGLIIPPPTITQ